MRQQEIMSLLCEAANPSCGLRRTVEIRHKLINEIYRDAEDGRSEEEPENIEVVLEKLFLDTLQNKPHLLPMLFPFFAVVCGDREDGFIVADVDWNII